MKNIKYHTVGTIPKANIKIVERDKIDTPNTYTNRNYSAILATLPIIS